MPRARVGLVFGMVVMLTLGVREAAAAGPALAAETPVAQAFAQDVTHLCGLIPERYVYFQARAGHWDEACAMAQAEARAVTSPQEGLSVLERLLDALYDAHVQPNVNNNRSPRVVPDGADLALRFASDEPGTAKIIGVRRGSAADLAGLRAGDRILTINGRTPLEAAMTRIRAGRHSVGPRRLAWALNAVAAGTQSGPRQFTTRRGTTVYTCDLGNPVPPSPDGLLSSQMLAGDVGYIRLHDSLGNDGTVEAFFSALDALRSARSWILDLRDTPSGGGTDVAEPLIGRFISQTDVYQLTVMPSGDTIARFVPPVPDMWTAEGPLIVLVGAWTGSMGEGMAVGFDGLGRGTVMGSPMAGLAGGIETFMLPATQIPIQVPTYDLRHVDGTPRDEWRPPILLKADPGGPDDPALETALARLQPGRGR